MDLVPPLAAVVLVVFFTALGFWQLDRAEEKRALLAAFAADGEPVPVAQGLVPPDFERLRATGHFLADRQFLIDNIVVDGRLGFYVITPMVLESGGLLLVNRGWTPETGEAPAIAIDDATRSVTGRAGHLPRVGLRPGEAMAEGSGWPKVATFPTADELARELGRDVLPFVLLADADPGSGLLCRWEPREIGPSRHLGYAFQWFALAVAVAAVTVVVYRHRRAAR